MTDEFAGVSRASSLMAPGEAAVLASSDDVTPAEAGGDPVGTMANARQMASNAAAPRRARRDEAGIDLNIMMGWYHAFPDTDRSSEIAQSIKEYSDEFSKAVQIRDPAATTL